MATEACWLNSLPRNRSSSEYPGLQLEKPFPSFPAMPRHFSPLSEGLVSFPPSCSWRCMSRCVYAHAQAYSPQVCLRDPTMSLHHKANGPEMLTKIFIGKDVHCHYLHILNNAKKKLRTLWYIFKMKHCKAIKNT